MKKFRLLLPLLLMTNLCVFSQIVYSNRDYIGIKVMTEIEVGLYQFKDEKDIIYVNKKGQFIKRSYRDENGSPEWDMYFIYDENGNITQIEKSWNTYTEYIPNRIIHKNYVIEAFERDSNGNLVKLISFSEINPSKIFNEKIYEYNKNNKRIQTITYRDGVYSSKYKFIRTIGNTDFWEDYDEKGKLDYRYSYTYRNEIIAKSEIFNLKNQETTITTFNENGKRILQEVRNESNTLLRKIEYNQDGEFVKEYYAPSNSYIGKEEVYKAKYNAHGDLLKTEYFVDDVLTEIYEYEYIYDYKGNWTSKIKTQYPKSRNFKKGVVFKYKRDIIYY